jgi:hypothetical protein
MTTTSFRLRSVLFAFGAAALLTAVSTEVGAQASQVDPAAVQVLKRMTETLGGLKQFSVLTQTNLEDTLSSGERVDTGVSARVTVMRPNKLHAKRAGDLVQQEFYYDGKSISLYNPTDKVFATEAAPPAIDGMLNYVRGTLRLGIPVGDLVYANAYGLLMQDVTSAKMLGKAMVGGVRCDHVAFRRPGVDFQVWVAEGKQALPCKYVVTDTSTPELLSATTVLSGWNLSPKASDASFAFAPPKGAARISFMAP